MNQETQCKRLFPAYISIVFILGTMCGMLLILCAFYWQSPTILYIGLPLTIISAFISGHMFWRIQNQRSYLLV